jgi:hypothetical protein
MEKPVLEKREGRYIVRVFRDEDPLSPEDWDNVGHLMTFHDQCYIQTNREFKHKEEGFKDYLRKNEKSLFIAPVYAYIHSGAVLSLSNDSYPFNDQWDACQIGVIYCPKKTARKELGKDYAKKIHDTFALEIKAWNQYLSGEVYGYTVSLEANDGVEVVESCYGFYGDPEDCLAEGVSTAKYLIKEKADENQLTML